MGMPRIARAGRTLALAAAAGVVLVAAWAPGSAAAFDPPTFQPNIDLPATVQPAPSSPHSSDEAAATRDAEPKDAVLDALGAFTALFALAGCVVAFLVVKSRRDRGDPRMRGAPVDRDFMEFG
jgi:hypothetical protein